MIDCKCLFLLCIILVLFDLVYNNTLTNDRINSVSDDDNERIKTRKQIIFLFCSTENAEATYRPLQQGEEGSYRCRI